MDETKKQISSKQIVMLIFIMGMSVKIFMMPVLLLKTSGKDSYFAVAIALIAELVCLFVLLKVNKKYPDQTYFEILQGVIGKLVGKIITVIFSAYFLLKLILVVTDIKVFFTVSVFENLPWPIFIAPLLLLLAALFVNGLRNLARTTEIFTPFIVVSAIIMCALLALSAQWENLLPILENGFSPIGSSLIKYPLWYGDFSVFILFLGKIKRTKSTNTAAMISAAITAIVVLLFSIIIFAAYSNIADILQYGQNITNLTQISLSGFNLGRLDILLFCVWMISVFIKAALLFNLVTSSVMNVLGAKNKILWSSVIAVIIYVVSVFVFPNEALFRAFAQAVSLPTIIVQYSVPLIIAACAIINTARNKGAKKVSLYEAKK